MEHGATEDEAIAALLHDAVEDQGGLPTLERIRARFGDNVAEIVLGCADSTEIDPARKQSWKRRKENYLAHLAVASHSVRLVSAADKLHNARSPRPGRRVHLNLMVGIRLSPRWDGGWGQEKGDEPRVSTMARMSSRWR